MQEMDKKPQKLDAKNWANVWESHLDGYLAAPPRTGITIHSISDKAKTVLEIACGSGRDSYYLCKQKMTVTAIDYAEETIQKLRKKFSGEVKFQSQDAFAINYNDKEFDLTFHNGFYVLFENNEDVKKLIREQARLTKDTMVIIEHNSRNTKQVNKFKNKAQTDPIYNIRFFDPYELLNIVKNSGIDFQSVRIMKFGGWPDILYAFISKFKFPKSPIYWIVPRLYAFVPWGSVERSMIVIKMKKD